MWKKMGSGYNKIYWKKMDEFLIGQKEFTKFSHRDDNETIYHKEFEQLAHMIRLYSSILGGLHSSGKGKGSIKIQLVNKHNKIVEKDYAHTYRVGNWKKNTSNKIDDAIRDAGKLGGMSPFAVDKLIDNCKYVEKRINHQKDVETCQKTLKQPLKDFNKNHKIRNKNYTSEDIWGK